jgi:hypothetical protein
VVTISKRRLRDPSTPRHIRWGARIIVGLFLGPFIIWFVALLGAQLVSTFG